VKLSSEIVLQNISVPQAVAVVLNRVLDITPYHFNQISKSITYTIR